MYHNGYSLLELLIVIAISSIMVMMTITNWHDMRLQNELANGTLELVTFFNQVKSDANIFNRNNAIYIAYKNQQEWQLIVVDNEQADYTHPYFKFIGKTQHVDIVEVNVEPILIFHGRRSMAQPATIKLKNALGESRIIVSTRGRIRFCSMNVYLAGFPKC